MLVNRGDQVAERHANAGYHVAFVGARVISAKLRRAGVLDGGFGIQVSGANTDFVLLEAGHTGRVAIHGAGIVGRRGAPGKTGSHPADTLFVKGETTGEQLSRGNSNR